jgi:ABC-type multidrug transport system fused ATPase/permease subunit
VELSGGEWQKLAVARCCFRDGQVVILDEPSAYMDPLVEFGIFEQLWKGRENRITVIISHRLATARSADLILVLSQGKVVESGAHDELMALKGNYHALFQVQARGYQ